MIALDGRARNSHAQYGKGHDDGAADRLAASAAGADPVSTEAEDA